MKQIIALFAITWLSLGLLRTEADDVSVEVFYNQLEPYGDWVDAGDYGYVWQPRDTGDDWRPYADGHWAYTDAGWTWLSDEPYSWAVYHYGRWTKIVDLGWVWVPGTEWGPAWVSFRYSNRHIGWAPLPPEAGFGGEVREIGAWSDSYYDVGPTDYVFVDARNFGAPRIRDVQLPLGENVRFIDETTNITNIRVENGVVFNGGPEYNVINRDSAQKIPRLRLERRTDGFGSDPNSFRATVQGNSLRVATPVIAAAAATVAPSKIARKLQNVQVNHGWKDAGDPAAVQKLRAKMKSEAKVPAGLPPQPKLQRTAATTGAGATTAVRPADAPAQPNGLPAVVAPGKITAPGEKPAAAQATTQQPSVTPVKGKKGDRRAVATPAAQSATQAATPPAIDKKGKRNKSTPAIAPAVAPAITPPEPTVRTESESRKPKPAPVVGAVPATEPIKPINREAAESAPHAPKPEPQVKPAATAPKPEAQAKPELHHEAAPAAAGDKGKKKDDKKDEKKDEKKPE
jgi:hypothetical protein